MGHHGIPGPGGSLGECAVCGESFIKEILLDESIAPFNLSYVNDTLYAHNPDCVAILKTAFAAVDKVKDKGFKVVANTLQEGLPEGPLKKALVESINKAETDVPDFYRTHFDGK